ncbi:guanine nucleotide exchange protein smcr8b [Triplophysa rosa]|uniref:Smith-Magenis syndrome chromosomal region candidate gene 8-B protein-like protein n=1 Tax=Triplophysa rosa TaxID=992332 RepID=A0A9W8C8B6_TRIRA|nr:guanine nucleotide exchange protein smcr8b [Triplophysa rosa]KAI7810685.1 Smith-Magenis syndrome chromosomal region candidate gene 8-B protein-like protein [Triplophysa rosa]
MIGSPDLVAFTKEPDFEDTPIDPFALPEELSVPSYTGDGTPWSKMSNVKFKKDFILLAEFSEQVGPQPLLTVPHETKACGTFDLNHFSLRIMSVDYQTSLTGSGINTPKLNFMEDSKVVLGDSKEGVFSYIHHFTLYDLEARGFVRPFCLAYVSSDENKIIQQFQQLSSEFSKVSECLKTGNRKSFANELETKLRDLEYTRVVLLRETEGENVMNSSVKYTNEREWTLNDIPTLERETENEKLKDKSLLHKEEVNVQEEAGHARQKLETRNCTLQLESENASNNRSAVLINRTEEQKDKLKKEYCSKPVDKITEELMNVEKSIQEHNGLLKQVTSYPTRKLRDSDFSPYEPDDLPHSLELDLDDSRPHGQFSGPVPDCSVIPYMNTPLHSPKLIDTTSCRRFDRRLKTLEELCDEYFHQQALQQLHSIEKTFRGDASHIYTNQLCQNLLRNLKSTNVLFEDTYDSEDAAGLQPGKAASHSSIYQASFLPASTILSEPVSLESYASCVEMVPIKLELGGSSPSVTLSRTLSGPSDENPPLSSEVHAEIEDNGEVSTPDCGHSQDAAVMKTSISSGDSIEVLGTEKSFRSQCSSVPSNTAMPKPAPTCTTAAPEGLKQARAPTGRTCSEDSIEVLSTTDSFLPEDLRASYPCAIDEESLEQDTDEKDLMSQNQKDKQVECVVDESHGCPSITLSPPDPAVTFPSDDDCHASCTNLSLLEEPCPTVRDDLSDCFSFRSTTASTASDTFSACIHGDKREGGSRQRCGRVGRAALKFLRQFPFTVHAVFSLLSGRTLVVLGSEEGTVRRLVAALSVYTPHSSSYRESVQPWISTQLQLTDLLNWKLIGFNRMCSPTPGFPHCLGHYSRYISVLDADQKTLRCPTYSGTLINHLVDPRSHIIRGSTYFLFAQSVLGKLVARAFFLTFSHTLKMGTNSRKSTQTVRCLEHLHRDDKKILHYLSELIKLHFTDVPPNVLRFSYTANSVFKL